MTQFSTTWPGVKCPSAMFPAVYSSKRGSYDISDRSNGRQYIIFHIAHCTLKCCYTVSLHRRTKINKSPACYVRRRYMTQSRGGDLNVPRTCRRRLSATQPSRLLRRRLGTGCRQNSSNCDRQCHSDKTQDLSVVPDSRS